MPFRGAGGTSGGTGMFLIGFALAVVGGYLLTSQVTVQTGSWTLFGMNAFGLSLIPFILGVLWLFIDGRSPWGFLLLFGGVLIILAGILLNLSIYFRPTSLFATLLMLAMLAAGVGLMIRALRSA